MIAFPLACSRRIRTIVSTTNIPISPPGKPGGQLHHQNEGSLLDADHPANGVPFARRSTFKKERIQIAFNPLSGRFDVADAAIKKDRAFIPDISVLWRPDFKAGAFRKAFLSQLKEIREISDEEEMAIEDAIDHLRNLPNYNFVALTLASSVDEETIAEVFVRINGKGKALNQADFIATLMSVFWEDGRVELENFSLHATVPSEVQASPYNHFIKPSPDQMLRATVGLALKRAGLPMSTARCAARTRRPA
ncbi:MAG: hypothetical protein R3E14_01030 [Erythrobacter sp.]